MPWTYDEIEQNWLAGGAIAISRSEVVAAFDRCERILGRDWIDRFRGNTRGLVPTLQVVAVGQRLASVDGLKAAKELIEKLGKDDPSARAELHAIHLLSSGGRTEFELFPEVLVGARRRIPDLRARRDNGPWVHVEVTRPDTSKVAEAAETTVSVLADTVRTISKPIALEVFLRREPSDAEVASLCASILAFCSKDGVSPEELPNRLGLLIRSEHPPGMVVPADHPGEEIGPRFGAARLIGGAGEPTRQVVVRMPFSDQRAEKFIHREAAQIPEDAPGLIMVDMTNTRSGFRAWEPLVRRRFQPAVHTRVGGICFFASGIVLGQTSLACHSDTSVLINPHAKIALPSWVETALTAAGAEYKQAISS